MHDDNCSQSSTNPSRPDASDRQPACRYWDGGDHAEEEYSGDVLVLVGHSHRHCEHDGEMGAVRGEIEIEEQSVCARIARGCEQEDRPDDVDGGEHDGYLVAARSPVEQLAKDRWQGAD